MCLGICLSFEGRPRLQILVNLGQKWARLQGNGGDCVLRNFMICAADHEVSQMIKLRRMNGRDAYRILVGKPDRENHF